VGESLVQPGTGDAIAGFLRGAKKAGLERSQIRFGSTSRSGASEPTRQNFVRGPAGQQVKVESSGSSVAIDGFLLMHGLCQLRWARARSVVDRIATLNGATD
jgi:hypothetical protein